MLCLHDIQEWGFADKDFVVSLRMCRKCGEKDWSWSRTDGTALLPELPIHIEVKRRA